MSDTAVQRRLAAILAADVAGFSRLVGADESGTLVAMRTVWGEIFNPTVARHGGRVFKTMGDGALAEFPSAVEAVAAALDIQQAMPDFNDGRAGKPPIRFRIGVNLGDIVLEGDDVLGDGVNVAARLEPLAPVGGVLLSDAVHVHVRGKVGAEFADGGERSLKNIAFPVRVWCWPDRALPAPPPPETETPAIAVLPFANLSGDPGQDYFSDGISEDIITDLSKVAGLTVVARNSSFAWRGKAEDVRVVGRELGVTSVVEGSIRRAGNRVRISAQLVDARTGHQMWAERFDRELTDIFEVQDEVTFEIVGALKVKLAPGERQRIAAGGTARVDAHDFLLRARESQVRLLQSPADGRAEWQRAMAYLDQAIAADPSYAEAHAVQSMAWTIGFVNHWTEDPEPLGRALGAADRALALNPDEATGHNARAIASIYIPDLDTVLREAQRAAELNPNLAAAYATLGHAHAYLEDPLAGIPYLERAIRLDPVFTQQYLHFMGLCRLMAGDYAKAAEVLRERVRLAPRTDLSRAFLASALGHLGHDREARQVWADLRGVNPAYSFADHLARLPFRRPADRDRIAAGLALAGIDAQAV
jgi:adenylate cyclase